MKRTLTLRWIGLLLLLSMLFLAALPTAALTPAYPITGTYLSSTYYDNLLHLPRTGDKAFDTVAIALSQLDYHEGNNSSDFDGGNTGGSRNYTEYNHAFGQIGGTYGYAWCAAFVSWCLEEADATEAAGGLFASCTLWVERLRELGQYSTRSSGYSPKAGDLIFFRSAGVSRASDHVGLVRYVKDGRVYTIEGNSSDRVSLHDYALSDTYIVGYGRPKYNSAYSLPLTALACEDKVTGWYTVTNSFLNIRASASSSSTKRGSLSKGDMVRIVSIKNGWGAFYYNGKLSYISLDYADFTAPLTYLVSYNGNGGENTPATASYFSMEEAFVSMTAPTKEGFKFLQWQDSSGTAYLAGDHLPAGDITLSAVWEAIPVAEEPAPEEPTTPDAPEEPTPEGPADESVESGAGEDFSAPVPGYTDELARNPEAEQQESSSAATVAAAIVVGLLTAGLGGWWVRVKLCKRKD
ncbi:MAG: CHAP domain-containing protein [Clostridia bacterium]|nr:CHAP domain-containing protein [Clostridia bacterium]